MKNKDKIMPMFPTCKIKHDADTAMATAPDIMQRLRG